MIYAQNTKIKYIYWHTKFIEKASVGTQVVYQKPTEWPPLAIYTNRLTIIKVLNALDAYEVLEYSKDKVTWTAITSNSQNVSINSNTYVYFRGIQKQQDSGKYLNITYSNASGEFKISGDIRGLLNYKDVNAPINPYAAFYLFSGLTNKIDASELILPDTVAECCYMGMFSGCTGLTKAPILRAKVLSPYCYNYMFQGCTSLTDITVLADDISAEYCTHKWVDGVTSTGTFNCKSTTNWTKGDSGIPNNFTLNYIDDMEYNSDYEIRLATLAKLGGDTTKQYDSVYSIDLAILALTGEGGGGSNIDDDTPSTTSTYSSAKIENIKLNLDGDIANAQAEAEEARYAVTELENSVIKSVEIRQILIVTQSEYNALVKREDTLYLVKDY